LSFYKNQFTLLFSLQKAAEQGHASAQCNLALCYENGTGVEKDEQKAVEWYENITII